MSGNLKRKVARRGALERYRKAAQIRREAMESAARRSDEKRRGW